MRPSNRRDRDWVSQPWRLRLGRHGLRLGYLQQPREQHRIGNRRWLRLRQLRLHPPLLRDVTSALGALVEVHHRVVVGVTAELVVDEHAYQVAKMGHDVASPGIRRAARGRGVLIRGRRLRSGARCSSAARS